MRLSASSGEDRLHVDAGLVVEQREDERRRARVVEHDLLADDVGAAVAEERAGVGHLDLDGAATWSEMPPRANAAMAEVSRVTVRRAKVSPSWVRERGGWMGNGIRCDDARSLGRREAGGQGQ